MRRLITLTALVMTVFLMSGCSYIKKADKKMKAVKYNDIKATFVTSQGDITFYLYPEAAPTTVANFINLAKRGYYDDNKIHRAVDNFIVQAGDPTETGSGGPGYTIPDEVVSWLDFYQQGMLAMANAGPGTAGSQYFFTLYPADWLNGKHTIFGEYVSDKDFETMRKLEYGDVIKEIKFTGEVDFFLSLHKDQVDQWNGILDEKYPELKKYPVKNPEEFKGQVAQYREELDRIYAEKENEENEENENIIPKFIRSVEKKIKENKAKEESQISEASKSDSAETEKNIEEDNEDSMQDSSGRVEVEKVDDKYIEGLDDLDETEESFWQKLKFWK